MKRWERIALFIAFAIGMVLSFYVIIRGAIAANRNDPNGITIAVIGLILLILIVAVMIVFSNIIDK